MTPMHDRKRSRCHAAHRVSEKMLSRPFGFPSLMPTPLRGCALRLPHPWPASSLCLAPLSPSPPGKLTRRSPLPVFASPSPHPFALSSFACAAACGDAQASSPLSRVVSLSCGEELREANHIKQRSKEPRALKTLTRGSESSESPLVF
ncbi:hypothetical protein ASA_2123 [Aeromonas salmonicida subsp. salmonicida A449]|uniref:Uncharacterized protein n=1 Tax=Aeromonas salmonicida (strain A449) TaxID=382245 RepID=A4SMR6_AERS4|nr:hypothetical protein ASA_2123 [Aeromonas salmonicida subsp. salmonicida A449]